MSNTTLSSMQMIPEATMLNNSNCTVDDRFKYTLYSTAFSLVFILGMLLNMVALYIFTCTLKERNETSTYMLNLVVCDTFFVFSLPLRIFYFITQSWPFGNFLCKVSVMLFYTNMYGSILFLTCISVDRFLAIVYPFASRSLRTKRKAKMACCAIWLIVLVVSLSAVTQLDKPDTAGHEYICFENYTNNQWKAKLSKVVMVIVLLGFVIPLLTNFFCSMMMLRTLRNLDTTKSGGLLNKAKILRMIVVHLFIFCFCFMPYNVNLVLYSLVRTKTISYCPLERVIRTVYPIGLCIAVTNCCFDPVIYYFTSETIQKSIKRRNALHSAHPKPHDVFLVPGASTENTMLSPSLSEKGKKLNELI